MNMQKEPDIRHLTIGQGYQPEPPIGDLTAENIATMLTHSTAALVRLGLPHRAADAFADGLSPDAGEQRSVMNRVTEELAGKTVAQVTRVAHGALRMLRASGVRLDRIIEDEIDEAVTEYTSRTIGLGPMADTLTEPPHHNQSGRAV